MRLRFIPLGVGDAFSALHYGSSLLVLADGDGGHDGRLLIDFPDPLFKVLREAAAASGVPIAPASIEASILTHLHGDHVNGLEAFGFYKRFVERRRPSLHAARPVVEELWDGRLRAAMRRLRRADGTVQELGLEDYFDVKPLEEGRPAAIGPFQVEVRQTVHHIPCFAVKVRAAGRTLAYSADTAFDPGLVDWLADGSDVVIHETNLGTHTPYETLAALPAELRARMRLIHYPDGFDVERSAIECLRQGRVYEVGS